MNEKINHIISRCSWDTSFDEKEKAAELQSRLSNWSRNKMLKEMNGIFEKLCPAGQVWNIQSLELDLGIIDFNDLESELTNKLRRQLDEKLQDIIHHSNNNVISDIEILDADISRTRLLSVFFIHGVLPWNYRSAAGSVNQLLDFELQHNPVNVISMLRNIAVAHHVVRKRIARQVSEPNITRIIHGLEPDNGSQIIDFTNELANIQAKKTIVKSGAGDFKQNLWLWVLNYLFASHGSVFNRKSFLKSSIRQMAGHYNIAYEELLELIERSVELVSDSTAVQVDLLQTLRMLTTEKQVVKNIIDDKETISPVSSWELLKDHFLNRSLLRSGIEKKEFNELVLTLSKKDKPRFRDMILSIAGPESQWQYAINDLDEHAVKTIFTVWDPSGSVVLTGCIQFLHQLGRLANLHFERNLLWQIGAAFLAAHKDTAFNSNTFLQYCLESLGRKGNMVKKYLLQEMMTAAVPASAKKMAATEIYKDLAKLLVSEMHSHENTKYYQEHFKELIDSVTGILDGVVTGKHKLDALLHSLLRNIQLDPAAAVKAFMQYREKGRLQWLLSYILTCDLAKLLLAGIENENKPVVLYAEEILTALKTTEDGFEQDILIEEDLYVALLNTMLFDQKQRPSEFLESFLAGLYSRMNGSRLYKFGLLVSRLLENNRIGITETEKDKIRSIYFFSDVQAVPGNVRELIHTTQNSQQQVANMLATCFDDNAMQLLRRSGNEEADKIIDYLLPAGTQRMNELINKYAGILMKLLRSYNRNEIFDLLKELYWRCILNYKDHVGKSELLESSFRAAIMLAFSFPGLGSGKIYMNDEDEGSFNEPVKLPLAETFQLLEKCIEESSVSIAHQDIEFQLDKLMDDCLRSDPDKLKTVIAQIPVSSKRVEMISTVTEFNLFSSCIIGNMDDAVKGLLEEIQFVYDKIEELLPFETAAAEQKRYWSDLWAIANSGVSPADGLKKILSDSVERIKEQTGEAKADILLAMQRDKIVVPPGKNESMDQLPGLDKIMPAKKIQWSAKLGWLDDLCYYLIRHKEIPVWYRDHAAAQKAHELLNSILQHDPVGFLRVLKRKIISESQMEWMCASLDFNVLAFSIGHTNNNRKPLLDLLLKLHAAFGKMTISGISSKQLQSILSRKLLNAWVSGNWRNISVENIWNELCWDLVTGKGLSKEQLILDIGKYRTHLPASLQVSFDLLNDHSPGLLSKDKAALNAKDIKQLLKKQDTGYPSRGGIAVKNAGLVIVSSYIMLLLERLSLVKNDTFVDETSQSEAVHYLQFLVTGLSNTAEFLLPLNKVLCGLPLSYPVQHGIVITESNKQLIEGLINAVIGYWPSIGDSSVNGFRGNWLVRDGLLTEQEDKWELAVEKRAYDVLIQHSPFSFSVIKYPWMNKPLHVIWPY